MSYQTHKFVKLIAIGDSGSGKTSLLSRYVNGSYSNVYKATVGASLISKKVDCDNSIVELQIWDTAGQERFQSLGASFYRGADACILVFDLCDKRSFADLSMWKGEFLLQTDYGYRDDSPFVIIGTKSDCTGDRIVSNEEVLLWCSDNGILNERYFETSAKLNDNVDEAFASVLQVALDHSYRQITYTPGVIDITDIENKRVNCMC